MSRPRQRLDTLDALKEIESEVAYNLAYRDGVRAAANLIVDRFNISLGEDSR